MSRFAVVSLFVLAGTFGVARAQAPSPEVRCRDGAIDLAGAGACANHGGLARTDVPPPKSGPATSEAEARKRAGAGTEPMALCNDGTRARVGEGACAYSGGVDRILSDNQWQATRTRPSSFYPKSELNTPAPTPGTSER
jgi:hypothetical protein